MLIKNLEVIFEVGKQADAQAQMLETAIERIAARSGITGLLERLRDARTKIAKSHDVERALNVGSGDIDAAVIGRMLDRGAPLSGGLETIGRFQQAFRPFARDVAGVPTPGVSGTEGLAAAHLGITGHAAGMGWLPAGLPLLRGPARSLMLSEMMQRPRTYDQGMLSRLASSPAVASGVGAVPFGGIPTSLADLVPQ